VCHTRWLCHFDKKKHPKAKEELWKLKSFIMQKCNLPKILSKKPQSFQDIITLYLISSFNTSQNIIFQKSSDKNRLLPRSQNPFKLPVFYNESQHNILALVGKVSKKKSKCEKVMAWKLSSMVPM